MASLFLPSAPNLSKAVLGLLGRGGNRQPSLGLMGADLGDEMFLQQYAQRGYEGQPEAPIVADEGDMAFRNAYAQRGFEGQPGGPNDPAASRRSAAPQRDRVSGWRLLDRVLGGQTVTEGLDAERLRLQAEAERPQTLAYRQDALSRITDPRERALFLGLGGEDWQKNVGQQFAPQVVAEGAAQRVAGSGDVYNNRRTREFGDSLVRDTDTGYETLGTRDPTFKERTDRFNAENPVLGANSTWVGPDGQPRAQGYIAPDIQNVAPGGEALVFDNQGNIINRVGSTQVRPISDADQKAIAEAEGSLARIDNATGRARQIIQQIDGGQLNLNPLGNFAAGVRNATGNSTEGSLAFADLKNWAEEARNEILQSANGVQTEGDALRALNVILAGTNDERIVKQALERYLAAKAVTRVPLERDIQRRQGQANAPASSGPIAQDAQGNRVQWNGSEWAPL